MKKLTITIIFFSLLLLLAITYIIGIIKHHDTNITMSQDFLLSKNTFFISIKNLKSISKTLIKLRQTSLPIIGGINKFIYSLEYSTKHKITLNDINQFLGEDFTLQIKPKFLLITKTYKKYTVFFYLKKNKDKKIKIKGTTIYEKDLKLSKKIYYTFKNNYLFASDNLNYLKKLIFAEHKKNEKLSFLTNYNIIIYDNTSDSKLNIFFKDKRKIIYGKKIDNLYYKSLNTKKKFTIDNPVFFTTINLSKTLNLKRKNIWAELLVHSILYNNNFITADFSVIVPQNININTKQNIKYKLNSILKNNKKLYIYPTGNFYIFSTKSKINKLKETDRIFYLNLKEIEKLPFFNNIKISKISDSIIIKETGNE